VTWSNLKPEKQPKRSKGRSTTQYRKVRRWVADRSGGWCEARVEGVCEGRGVHAHHILPRSAGGPDEPGNLLWVCRADHQYIHEHPAWAYQAGMLRRRTA
jgi:hypothetical protein